MYERKWNDHKDNKDRLVQGKFVVEEIKSIMNSLCQWALENHFVDKELINMCSLPASELKDDVKRGWCKIAEALPNRSVQSIHNFCRRRFNPDNYSGKWTQEEE